MIRFKFTLLIFLIFSASYGKDLALVIGGTSTKSQDSSHEFGRAFVATSMGLRASGKEVTTLFGYADTEEQMTKLDRIRKERGAPIEFELEREKYSRDYEKINQEFPETKSITRENILQALRDNLNKAASGDTFTLVLNAHGHVQCPGQTTQNEGGVQRNHNAKNVITSDFDPNCHHEISIASTDGSFTTFKTEEIFPILKEMENKGVEVNTIFDSCFSGIIKKEADQLNDTCSVFLSSGNSEGFGCFEEDPEGSIDYTSTLEYVKYSLYAGVVDTLSQDPYFSESRCFNSIREHAESIGVNQNSTIADSFWRARENDWTIQEPGIGDSVDMEYFRQGNYSREFSFTPEVMCSGALLEHLNELKTFIPESSAVLFEQIYQEIERIMSNYNDSVQRQAQIKSEFSNLSEEQKGQAVGIGLLNELSSAQERTAELVEEFISQERRLSPLMRMATELVNEEVSCERSI